MLDRVVIDSNILISKIISGHLADLADTLIRYNVLAFTCKEQLDELERNLLEPRLKKFLIAPLSDYMKLLRQFFIVHKIDLRFDRGPAEDNYLIDLAYSVKSFYVVTGDHGLLALKHVGKIQVITFAEWKKLLLKNKFK